MTSVKSLRTEANSFDMITVQGACKTGVLDKPKEAGRCYTQSYGI